MHLSINDIGNTILIAAVVLFVLYRRFRRNFGRQRLRQNRMIFRMLLLSIFCLLLLLSPNGTTKGVVAAFLGAALGAALAIYATAHTQFEITPQGKFFIPNGYIGMTVTALFIGRLIYRFVVLYPMFHNAVHQLGNRAPSQMSAFSSYERSPFTLGLYFLLAGYYICYYAFILMKSRELHLEDGNKGSSKYIS